jgi:hypothetical protein
MTGRVGYGNFVELDLSGWSGESFKTAKQKESKNKKLLWLLSLTYSPWLTGQ